MWTDLILTLILIGGLLTILIKGSIDSGGMSAIIEKAYRQDHFQQDSFSFDPTEQVRFLKSCIEYSLVLRFESYHSDHLNLGQFWQQAGTFVYRKEKNNF